MNFWNNKKVDQNEQNRDTAPAQKSEELDQLKETVNRLQGQLQQVGEYMSNLSNQNAQIMAHLQDKGAAGEEDQESSGVLDIASMSDEELDNYTPQQLEKIRQTSLLTMMEKAVEKVLKPVNEKVISVEKSSMLDKLKQELVNVRDEKLPDGSPKRPDFDAYKETMSKLAGNPSYQKLGVNDLYVLAKSQNPEVGEKWAEENSPKIKQSKSSEDMFFGGLEPSSTDHMNTGTKTVSEGFDEAWNSVMEG